jgi:hypothetical protein
MEQVTSAACAAKQYYGNYGVLVNVLPQPPRFAQTVARRYWQGG